MNWNPENELPQEFLKLAQDIYKDDPLRIPEDKKEAA